MNIFLTRISFALPVLMLSLGFRLSCGTASARVLDNFDDNIKTGWTDFTFIPGFGLPVEGNGQFTFTQPPAGQAIFSASTKTSETITVQEGRTVEFRVDLVTGNGKDAFAVLAFIPTGNSPSTLAGYGLAKSSTDILVTKGIGKYFYNENPVPAIKNDNVTLVLSLTGKDGNVIINAKVLDRDNNCATIFDKTFVDTPAADVLSDGTDDPAAPYLGAGYFTLYLYQDFDPASPQASYEVTFDNAEVSIIDRAVLDNFDDNVKTGWTDFSFINGFGLPVEANGQFTFTQPPAGQAIFSASTKTSQEFPLTDGEHLEFSVDLVSGNGKDAFAVLAFIPSANSPSTLAGYGMAKSSTDILITKGIGKYFYNENPVPAIKNDNVTLVLSLAALNGKVLINGKVLDKDNNNAVIFDKTFVDTQGQDVLSDGTDDPAAPYLGSGHFTLYLYQDFDPSAPQATYEVIYDNAIVGAPPAAANAAPLITDIQPAASANFLPASTLITFTASDDKPLQNNKISVTLNGTVYTSANGLNISGAGNSRDVSLGGLAADVNYIAVLQVVDSDNATNSATLYFDTFNPNNTSIEVEDYNFSNGQFLDFPILTPEGSGPDPDSYRGQVGAPDVDYTDTRTDFRSVPYRPGDHIRMQRSLDAVRQIYLDYGGSALGYYDYDVGDIAAGEWMDYTRNFTPGSYHVYLRESLVNLSQSECVLEKVTSDPSQPDQITTVLGSFLGRRTGFEYRNFQLTDGLGQNPVIVRLTGAETLRLRQVTSEPADGSIFQNYLILVPTTDPGLQHASITGVSPAPGAIVETVTPTLSATIQNRDTDVKPETIVLSLNGITVTPVIVSDASGAVVTYALDPLPPPNSLNTARIIFTDDFNFTQTNQWTFTITYKFVDPANRSSGPGIDPGFSVRVVQAPIGTIPPENSLARAEDQLAPNSIYPAFYDVTVVADVINYTQKYPPAFDGYIQDDLPIPGLYDEFGTPNGNGTDDIAMEVLTYLDLSAGIHRFGVKCDDGYKIVSGRSPHDANSQPLAFHNGGPADESFDFVVLQPGLYPFRMVWYERGGDAYVEWFSIDRDTNEKTLINDPNSPNPIKAYVTRENVFLQSAAAVQGLYTDEPAAALDAAAKRITVLGNGSVRFYRLRSDTSKHIKKVQIVGPNVVIDYE